MVFHRVFLAGVTAASLQIIAPAQAATIDLTTLQLNNVASASSNALVFTQDGEYNTASSAFLTTGYATAGLSFTSSFDFSLSAGGGTSGGADGLAFLIQGNSPTVTGAGGGDIGAGGILNAIGVGFQSWYNNHATIFTSSERAYGGVGSSFNLHDQPDNVSVVVTYAADLLSYTAVNHATGQTVSGSRSFDLTSLGSTVYLGFTAGTGGDTSTQTVSNFTLAAPGPIAGAGLPAFLCLFGFGLYRRFAPVRA